MTLDADVVRDRCSEIEQSVARLVRTLESAGIIPPALSNRLQQMARFRNLLVHVYWTVDYTRVFNVLETDLDDLLDFARIVAALT